MTFCASDKDFLFLFGEATVKDQQCTIMLGQSFLRLMSSTASFWWCIIAKENVCVCVCVCVRERENERESAWEICIVIDGIAGVRNIYHFCLWLMSALGRTAEGKKGGNRLTLDQSRSSDLKTLKTPSSGEPQILGPSDGPCPRIVTSKAKNF